MAIIEVKHLHKVFGDLEVLKDISFNVEEGEVICLIGPSGSGKSTLLRCLNKLEEKQDGDIVILGENISEIKKINQFRENIGMVFQHFNLFPNYTVLQNMTLAPTMLKKMSKAEAVKKAEQLGIETISTTVTKNDKVGYMPDVNNITIKLIADKSTGKLLGCQGIGAGDADKRVNTVTSSLLAGLTVDEFYRNDLTYAPPFSPTIDPLLNAAQILLEKLNKTEEQK